MSKFEDYRSKPEKVKAVRFWNWSDAIMLYGEGINIFYVAVGADHSLRYPYEKDRSNGHVLKDADSFLVLRNEAVLNRVNHGDWIVIMPDGHIEYMDNDEFEAKYNKTLPGDE